MITELIDYETIQRYARQVCRDRGIRESDWDDIAHDAWLEATRRARSARAESDSLALANRIMYTSVQNAANHYRRWYEHIPIFEESDGGAEAERLFLASDDWTNPFWLRLFNAERKNISRNAKKSPLPNKAVHELLKDSSIPDVRAKMQISRPTMRTIIRFLKSRFELSYQALRAYRAFRSTLLF